MNFRMNIIWFGIILVTNFVYGMNSNSPSIKILTTKKEESRKKWIEEHAAVVTKSKQQISSRLVLKGEITEGEKDIYVKTYKEHAKNINELENSGKKPKKEDIAAQQFAVLEHLQLKKDTNFKIIRVEIDKKMFGSIPAFLNPKEDGSCSVVIFDMSFDTNPEDQSSLPGKFSTIIWQLCPNYHKVKCYIATMALYKSFVINKLEFTIEAEDKKCGVIKKNFTKYWVAPAELYSIYSKNFENPSKLNEK